MAKKTPVEAHDHVRKMEKQKELQQKEVKEKILKDQMVPFSIPPIYRKRIGANLPVSVNLETITIPVDGKTYKIPKSFANQARKMLVQIDKEEMRNQHNWRGNQGNVYPTGPIPGQN